MLPIHVSLLFEGVSYNRSLCESAIYGANIGNYHV
jgi:hypothetical protein